MMERESGHINERFRLWEEVSEQGRTMLVSFDEHARYYN